MEHRNTMLGEDITSGLLFANNRLSSYSLKQEASIIYSEIVHYILKNINRSDSVCSLLLI